MDTILDKLDYALGFLFDYRVIWVTIWGLLMVYYLGAIASRLDRLVRRRERRDKERKDGS